MSTSTESRPVTPTAAVDETPGKRWWSVPPKLPFLTRRNRMWWYPLLVVVAGLGAVAMLLRLINGLAMTELTTQVPWGAWVAFYIYFVGLSAGPAILSSLVFGFRLKQAEGIGRSALLLAALSLGVGLAFIGVDMGRLDRAINVMLFFHWTSPLSWAVRSYMVYLVIVVVQLVYAIRLQRGMGDDNNNRRVLKILSAIGLPLAIIGVLGAEGALFAVVSARGTWSGGLFPVILLASAILAGAAMLIVIHYLVERGSGRRPNARLMRFMSGILLAGLFVDAGLTFYEYGIPLLARNHHETQILDVMMFGPYAWTFWILQIALGLVLPIIILMIPKLRASTGWVAAAAGMVVVGIMGVRFNIVLPPQITPVLNGYPNAHYFPSLMEWGVAAFLIAGGVLVYSLVSAWQPIHDPARVSIIPDTAPTTSPARELS
ncbi:MAG: polysulfide reductase NrfD [Propionibacteriaceae bacterium]|nr:polysulfide reductase NrfD [Propionibacteriaceae bacterium]